MATPLCHKAVRIRQANSTNGETTFHSTDLAQVPSKFVPFSARHVACQALRKRLHIVGMMIRRLYQLLSGNGSAAFYARRKARVLGGLPVRRLRLTVASHKGAVPCHSLAYPLDQKGFPMETPDELAANIGG